jgi:UDP-2,3-diacylglucosamine hydrolase
VTRRDAKDKEKAAAFFVADGHLDEREEGLAAFEAFLRSLPGKTPALYVLGDLFNLWMGYPHLELAYHRRIVEILSMLDDEGTAVSFVEGNRDFFLREGGRDRIFARYSRGEMSVEAAGRRIALFHGDMVNTDDRMYRAWHAASKSRAASALARMLPPRPGRSVAAAAERRLRSTNLAYKVHFPEAHCLRYAESKFREGHDAVILGHFHTERRYDLADGALFVMPMWGEARRHLRLDSDGTFRFEAFSEG